MELRDIEIFLTLAEELHFGRTASRLYVSQARVSQAIKAQERRIGGSLFERTSRSVRLTPLGERLAVDLRVGYEGIQRALAEATAVAGQVRGTLTVGVMGALGHELGSVAAAFTARHPDCRVEFREVHFSEPFTALRQGTVDTVLLWLPVREPDVTVGPVVLTEGRVLAVATQHPLAGRTDVELEDLGDHPVLAITRTPGCCSCPCGTPRRRSGPWCGAPPRRARLCAPSPSSSSRGQVAFPTSTLGLSESRLAALLPPTRVPARDHRSIRNPRCS
ncbi:LysR family transcriptional regulator [Streptomyces sp. NPDC047046]|uniref:LysR family transcriptional regulator n=1 Tax=Streptomyces sp. NPDC047046 TaxID=3155378 RepID=UPI003401F1D3